MKQRGCLNCRKPTWLVAHFKADRAQGAPAIRASCCPDCGTWLKEGNKSRIKLDKRFVPRLSSWAAFAAGTLYERMNHRYCYDGAAGSIPLSAAPPEIRGAIASAVLNMIAEPEKKPDDDGGSKPC